jgi:hypothetical protein
MRSIKQQVYGSAAGAELPENVDQHNEEHGENIDTQSPEKYLQPAADCPPTQMPGPLLTVFVLLQDGFNQMRLELQVGQYAVGAGPL